AAVWPTLPLATTLGRCLLGEKAALKDTFAAAARPAVHGCKFRRHSIGTDRRARSQENRKSVGSDPERIVGAAARFEWTSDEAHRSTPRIGGGNRPQPYKEGCTEAGR